MTPVFEKRSPKAARLGYTIHYQITEDGTQIWVKDRSDRTVWERKTNGPEQAFSHCYRWLKRMEQVESLLHPEPAEDVELGAKLDLIAMRLSALIDRADAISAHITTLLKTADKIFAHAEHVLQELS